MSNFDWDAIRAAHPIADIVGQVVPLTRAGNGYKGRCPFHADKSPSFHVVPDKDFAHCFGCGWHGDVVDFIARQQGMTLPDAVVHLTGGQSPTMSDIDRDERQKWMAVRDDADRQSKAKATIEALRRWNAAHSLEGGNAYLERKGVAPHSCRVENGNLILPIYDAAGEIMSVQAINPEGRKKFHPGAPVRGGRMNIGIHLGRTILCEGYATGASVYEALPDQVCVTFSLDNMENIAREYAAKGISIILAADSGNAADRMIALGDELNCPVVVPAKGSDFNDQYVALGIDSVRQSFAAALVEFQNKPEPPPPAPFCNIEFVEAFDFDETQVPLRPWLVPGAVLSGCTHILAAPGGTGKSLFTLQFAIMMANGEPWGKWHPKRQCRVMIINAEDDVDEQRRRLSAAKTVMGCAPASGIMIARNPSSILTAAMDEKSKRPVATPLVEQLVATIRHHAIDVIIVDPFAETFEGDENDNNHAKWAMKIWRDDIARATGCAVYLVHHTTKNSGDKAGSADAIRGAGALVNSARIASTLFVMTKDEAAALNVKEEERFRYVRYDDAKANQSLIGARHWFEKISVVIRNGPDGDSQGGDEVGALKPWSPDGMGNVTQDQIDKIVSAVRELYYDDDGVCTDQPFTPTKQGGSKRWVGFVIMDCCGCEEDAAKSIFRGLVDGNILAVRDYHDDLKGRDAKGVFAG